MGALWVSGSPEAQAQTYAVGDPIKGVLTARSGYVSATDTLTVSAGTDVSFSVSGPANNGTAQDIDYQMANGVAVAGAYDNVTYAWTVDGRALLGTDDASRAWKAEGVGPHTIKCVLDDGGEPTYYDDAAVTLSVTVTVTGTNPTATATAGPTPTATPRPVPTVTPRPSPTVTPRPVPTVTPRPVPTVTPACPKTWNPKPDISGGQLRLPQDQRSQPFAPAAVTMLANDKLLCTVVRATDSDIYEDCGGTGTAADTITYTWSADRGSFPRGQGSTSVDYLPPTDYTGPVRITCVIDDGAVMKAGEGGKRHDGPLKRLLVVQVNPLPVASVSLSTNNNKTVLCAGGLDSEVHRVKVVTTVRDTAGRLMRNRSVLFSWDPPGPIGLQQSRVNTDASGTAVQPVISGDEPGRFEIRAECEGKQAQPLGLTVEEPEAAWKSDPEVVVADGEQQAKISVTFTLRGVPVPAHQLEWKIVEVLDENNEPVKPDARGNYPGFGHLAGTYSTTNASGIATNVFTAGTEPGTVIYRVQDQEWYEKPGASLIGGNPGGKYNNPLDPRKRRTYTTLARWTVGAFKATFGGYLLEGFDNSFYPKTLMVPQGGTNLADGIFNPQARANDAEFVRGTNSSVATITSRLQGAGVRRLVATGVKEGKTDVLVRYKSKYAVDTNQPSELARLQLAVRERRAVTLTVYLCRDQVGSHTGTDDEAANRALTDGIVQGVNNIWGRQANIYLVAGTTNILSLNKRYSPRLSDIEAIEIAATGGLAKVDATHFNLFVVWAFTGDTIGIDLGYTGQMLLATDNPNQGRTVAHEVGHAMQVPHPEELVPLKDKKGNVVKDKNGNVILVETPRLLKMHDRLMHPSFHPEGQRIGANETEVAHRSFARR